MSPALRTLSAILLAAATTPLLAATVTLTPTSLTAYTKAEVPGGSPVVNEASSLPMASTGSFSDAPNSSYLVTALADTSGRLQTGSSTGLWASGHPGQGLLVARSTMTTVFTPSTSSILDINYLMAGAQLYVNGDYGGTGLPAVEPFTNTDAGTVGAHFAYSISIHAAGLHQTLLNTRAQVWGHGDYWVGSGADAVLVPRRYELDADGLRTTMDDRFCVFGNCYGKDVFIEELSGSLRLAAQAGVEYTLSVILDTSVVLQSFENEAWSVAQDPNSLGYFRATLTPDDPNVSSVPEPTTPALLLAACAALGWAGRRTRPHRARSSIVAAG